MDKARASLAVHFCLQDGRCRRTSRPVPGLFPRGQEMASGYSGPRQPELTGNKDSLSASGEEGWL